MRAYLVVWHRWVGLTMAGFLVVAGFTGAIIAFEEEVDGWLNPHLLHPAWQAGGAPLNAYALREAAQRQAPAGMLVDELLLHVEAGESAAFRLTPGPSVDGKAPPLLADEMFVHPQTAAMLGMRLRGESLFERETLVGFLYKLHYSLALPGNSGRLIFGIIAVLWTLDSVIAFYLTLPRRQQAAKASYLSRWKPAWLIKWQAGATRINFDLHRAFGLWLCLVLLMFAWSSVMFNLREQVYMPMMKTMFAFDLSWRAIPPLAQPLSREPMPWPHAHAMARHAMQRFSAERGLKVDFEDRLRLDRQRGLYAYFVHSNADLRSDRGNTAILIDAATGEIKGWWLPTGDKAGNTVSNWLGALHMGQVFGLPYRIFVSFCGLALVLVSVTGVLIWWKKRHGKQSRRVAR
ncbi:PepSY domain-containing protein [Methylovorus menthalis]|uniref:PepSY-associated TM helix domain-containing protein n=1 Tax=Methylovorus menthalis TaxID=1002227 RepID=UPI001E5316ED|nr:PepSY-associated TM helix domain-containing protein [Methylovorus menthalis]MCB4811532.1 PepSY domain-containing protein [Methylovorus menthalis]